ncbi:hypothetical protein K2X89_13305 [Myxococcota bacterium]|nr:hypothetical protein [Myxococcota bacterium]
MDRLGTAALLLLLLIAGRAMAGDGVVEINQTCAAQTGCAPGDTPGFPVTLTAAGSYRLTSSLAGGALVAPAYVSLDAPDITLDLNGFAIRGQVTTGCNPTGLGGIRSTAPGAVVMNGRVSDTAGPAIALLGEASIVRDVQVDDPGCYGIRTGDASLVLDSTVRNARGLGIAPSTPFTPVETAVQSERYSIIRRVSAVGSIEATCIRTGFGSLVADSATATTFPSYAYGIFAGDASIIIDTVNSGRGYFTAQAPSQIYANGLVLRNGGRAQGLAGGSNSIVDRLIHLECSPSGSPICD